MVGGTYSLYGGFWRRRAGAPPSLRINEIRIDQPSGSAGDTPGDLVGEVTVLRQPYTVEATVQNYAGSATGPWGGQLRASLFGLTGLGDATTLSIYATSDLDEQVIAQAAHVLGSRPST